MSANVNDKRAWEKAFIKPIAKVMKERGIAYLLITMRENDSKACYVMEPVLPPCSAIALAARQSPVCACGRPKDHGPEDTGCIVCWHCFKDRDDGLRFKDFRGSYEDWIKLLPNADVMARGDNATPTTQKPQ